MKHLLNMKPRHIAIVIITSLASASFTAAFVLFNVSYTNSSVVRVKEISPDRETIDFKIIMTEIAQIKTEQENLAAALNALTAKSGQTTESAENPQSASVDEKATDGSTVSTEATPEPVASEVSAAKSAEKTSEAGKEKTAAQQANAAESADTTANAAANAKPEAKKAADGKQSKPETDKKDSKLSTAKVNNPADHAKDKNIKLAKIDKKPNPSRSKSTPIDSKPSGRHLYLMREFNKEQRDPSWSGEAMVQIMDSISKEVAQKSEFLSMDCRTTFCRIRFEHENKSSAGGFIKRLSKALTWSNSTLEVFFTQEAKIITDIFIFRGGEF